MALAPSVSDGDRLVVGRLGGEQEAFDLALNNGAADGHELLIRADEGYGLWLFLPDRYDSTEDGKLRPVALDVEGFTDSEDVNRALPPAG